jgi:hypothetical protein
MPKRFTEDGIHSKHHAQTPQDHFRPMFFELIIVLQKLTERFDTNDVSIYMKLEQVLLTGKVDIPLIKKYNDFNVSDLDMELKMFHRRATNPILSLDDAVNSLRRMSAEMKFLFCKTDCLARLLLVCPMSSSEAEHSFSGLRRLKTWLRATMMQKRLNSVAICTIHQEYLDAVNGDLVMNEFISHSDICKNLFG